MFLMYSAGHMNGGHYTAFVKCNDELNLSTSNSLNSVTPSTTSNVCPRVIDALAKSLKLSPSESSDLESSDTLASCGHMFLPMSPFHNNSGVVGEGVEDHGRWVLFDDEIVHDVPPDRLSQYIVTGNCCSCCLVAD
jgi:hypothetical protein